jgi:ATP-dependent DNA ligase
MNLIKPMKMTDVPVTTAEQYITDPSWVMEQKMDGARALVSWSLSEGFTWQASGGGPLKFAAAVQHFEVIEAELIRVFGRAGVVDVVLDAELIVEDAELRVFDVVRAVDMAGRVFVGPDSVTAYRLGVRDGLIPDNLRVMLDHVKIVRTAWIEKDKRSMWEDINAAGVEGAMVKELGGVYEPGVRTKSVLKLKLVKTVDAIVTAVDRKFDHKGMVTHGSADLALMIRPEQDPLPYVSKVTGKRITAEAYDQGLFHGTAAQKARALAHELAPRERIQVGAASLIGKDLTIDVGDVVEVAYLYWGGGALVQPRILRKRLPEEKLPDDCHMDQVPAYSRRAV